MEKQISQDILSDPISLEAEEEVLTLSDKKIRLKDFIFITKPGILFSNLITAFGGYWVAAKWHIQWDVLLYTMLGTLLVMAASTVFNNFLDRDRDKLMKRTQKRPLAAGRMSPVVGYWYGIILGVAGLSVLALAVNPLSSLLGFIGMFVYVVVYTAWLKRTSVWNTVVGSIAGAMPPVIGYVAITNNLDIGAWILFGILFLWQPPHFWALSMRRADDYKNAGFPMLPVVKGNYSTKVSMLRYVAVLVPVSLLLFLYHYVNVIYLIAAAVMGLMWAWTALKGFKAKDDHQWATKMFVLSINYLTILFIIMVITTTNS